MKRLLSALVAILVLWLIRAPVVAAAPDGDLKIIFSNFNEDPNEKYDGTRGWGVLGKQAHNGLSILAMPFTPTENHTIWRIKIALEGAGVGPHSLTIGIRADADGLPGELLGRVEMTGVPPDSYDCCPVGVVWLTDGIPVLAGTQYWLVAHAKDDDQFRWNWSNPHQKGDFAYKTGSKWKLHHYDKSDYFNTLGAFSISGK